MKKNSKTTAAMFIFILVMTLTAGNVYADMPTCPAIQGDLLAGGTIDIDPETWPGVIVPPDQWFGSSELLYCTDLGKDAGTLGSPFTLEFVDNLGNIYLVRFYVASGGPRQLVQKPVLEILSPLNESALIGHEPLVRAKCWAEFHKACYQLESP